jgi:hypothetical protein
MSIQSDYVYNRGYRGKVKGLVLDWSGTTADEYVLAPAVVFVDVLRNIKLKSAWQKQEDRWDCARTFTSSN